MKYFIPLFLFLISSASMAADRLPNQSTPESTAIPYFAANCFNCHGTDGKGSSAIPRLAGRDKAYLIESWNNFKSGARPATIMHQLAKGYTDEEAKIMAEFFSKQ